jgi:hypothetical protein
MTLDLTDEETETLLVELDTIVAFDRISCHPAYRQPTQAKATRRSSFKRA